MEEQPMHGHEESLISTGPAPFVARGADDHREGNSDRTRYVLWQATGIIIDDTDFGSGVDVTRSRFWFPPCTWRMSPAWWARMREAAERLEEALRTGTNLLTLNFAEQVVLAAVLRSDAPQQVLDSLVGEEPEGCAAVVKFGDEDLERDLEFGSVLVDMLDDSDAELLYSGDLLGAPAALAHTARADLEHWFDPSSLEHARSSSWRSGLPRGKSPGRWWGLG
jgi:hypothetical protein